MPDTTYAPRPGSKAEGAVIALSRTPWLSNADLAAELDIERANLQGNLAVPVREGLIRKVARDGVLGYALGATADAEVEGEPPPQRTRRAGRVAARKAAPAARSRKARARRAATPVDEPPRNTGNDTPDDGVIAVLEDGRVAVFAGDAVAHMLPPALVRRIVELVQRLSARQ